MTTLFSFLGTGVRNKNGDSEGYRLTKYEVEPGAVYEEPYLALALQKHFKPERLIIAGTDSSMWDVFFMEQETGSDTMLEALETAVRNSSVTQQMLNEYAPLMSKKLDTNVQCQLISKATTKEDQVSILQTLAERIPEEEKLLLDVTHSFRHLPMLAMVAARYLSHVKNIQIQDIYYGAWEMREDDTAPVLKLKGMLDMLDWVEALAIYDNSGDYGVFAPLLVSDGMTAPTASLLEQAAFYERTNNVALAAPKLSTVSSSIEEHQGPLGKLFREALFKRIQWFKRTTRAGKERALAESNFKHKDYLRAAISLFESETTKEVNEQGLDEDNYENRKAAYESFEGDRKELKNLRNNMAHGNAGSDKKVQRVLKDEKTLRTRLSQLFNQLKP